MVHVIRSAARAGAGAGAVRTRADSGDGLPRTPCAYEEGRVTGDSSGTVVSWVTASTEAMHVDVRVARSDPRAPSEQFPSARDRSTAVEDVNAVEDLSRSAERREMCAIRFFLFSGESHTLKKG